MSEQIDYYLSLQSPWTWLGHNRLVEIAERHGATINCLVTNFGTVFAQSGGLPLGKRAPQRQAYRLVELGRWRDELGVSLNIHPAFFPVDEALGAKIVTALRLAGGDATKLAGLILKSVWADEKNISDEATLRDIATEAGLNFDELLAAASGEAVTQALQENTAKAVEAGVFGAPSFVLRGEIFWGQDRLSFLDKALADL